MKNHPIISRPSSHEYPVEFDSYIKLVQSNDLLGYFATQSESLASVAAGLSEEQLLYRYAEGKWSMKDVFTHMIDCERIYCYRALSIARGEKKSLPGFEENEYASFASADKRDKEDIITDYYATRAATIELFKSFDEEMLNRMGIANDTLRSVRSIGYLAAGHELHHLGVLKERYLKQ
jgi:uncharacterized damage-inducible protein DinB